MKREIEFRGQRTDNKEWVYGDLLNLHNGDKYIVNNKFGACIDDKGNFINTESPFVFKVIPETVGQYTGITDKNGKKVYKGDIVKIYYCNNEYIGKVVFNERTCGFEFWYNTVVGAYGEKATHKMNFAQFNKCEVIGTVFDEESDNGD